MERDSQDEITEVEIGGVYFRWFNWKSEKNFRDHGVAHYNAAKMLLEKEIGYGKNPNQHYPNQYLSLCLTLDGARLITVVYENGFDMIEEKEYTFIITLWKTTKAEERRLKND